MRIDIAAQTDTGRRKSNNEDYYGVFRENVPDLELFDEGALLCVADGLGGHTGGEIASKLAVSVIKDMLKEPWPGHPEDLIEEEPMFPVLRKWIMRANESLDQTNKDFVKNGKPMGTTLLTAVVTPKKVYLGNVGDSRCYLLRDQEIIDQTTDHSWVDEQVKKGLMSRSEAESDTRRNLVTRCIGTHSEVEVDTYVWNVVPGDILLLCTDGLVNMLKDSEVVEEFKKGGTVAEIATRLVNRANENGGKDNITVILAHVSPHALILTYTRLRGFCKRNVTNILWFLFSVATFAGGLFAGMHLF